jgi:alpha-1,3-mannosyltransferase
MARRVVHVVRRFAPLTGGTERLVLDLASAQARSGHRVTVVTGNRDVTGISSVRLARSDRIGSVRVMRLPVVGTARSTVTLDPLALARAIRSADAVHLHDLRFMTALTAVSARASGRFLFVHTHGLFFHTSFAARLKRVLLRSYYAPLLRAAGAWVVASSEPDRATLLDVVPSLAPRVRTLENGLELGALLANPRRPDGASIVVHGRIVPSKGLDDLVRALPAVPRAKQLVLLGSAGEGERERLEELAAALGVGDRLEFHGSYSDAALLGRLATASVAAFPSHAEGFGLALLEALAAGVPVVARDIPAHRALLGEDLASALVDASDPAILASALDTCLGMGEPERSLVSERARHRARSFDIRRLARQVEALYEEAGVGSTAP